AAPRSPLPQVSSGFLPGNKKARLFGLAYLGSLQNGNLQQLCIVLVLSSVLAACAGALQAQHFFPSCYPRNACTDDLQNRCPRQGRNEPIELVAGSSDLNGIHGGRNVNHHATEN